MSIRDLLIVLTIFILGLVLGYYFGYDIGFERAVSQQALPK